MIPDVVADVGNTRIKWGRCTPEGVVQVASLPPDSNAWHITAKRWNLSPSTSWAIAGVHPQRREALAAWLKKKGFPVSIIDSCQDIPLSINLDSPQRVGLDRLFDAVAANSRRQPQHTALVVDAGSAITVNLVDEDGAFRGGAIMPGLRLMAQALRDHTAQLPLVEVTQIPSVPATDTVAAIAAGIVHAALGGIGLLLDKMTKDPERTDIFFTGGDAPLLAQDFPRPVILWPQMTLEGIRLSATRGLAKP